jgi:hypothetical protein
MKHTIKNWLAECKKLNGDPRYISRGMAIGIFVSMTPFIPFHTAIAVTMSVVLRGSKRAAAIGVWLSNPLTFPFFYFIMYKLGMLILGNNSVRNPEWKTFSDILELGAEIAYAMIIGGLVLGTVLAIPAYYITKRIFKRLQNRANNPGKQSVPPLDSSAKSDTTKN